MEEEIRKFIRRTTHKLRGEYIEHCFYLILASLFFLEGLIFFVSHLFLLHLAFYFYLLPIPFLLVVFLFLIRRCPGEAEAVLFVDRHFHLEERLVTSYEILQGEIRSSLRSEQLKDTLQLVKGIRIKGKWKRYSVKVPLTLVLSALLLVILLPFLPRINWRSAPLSLSEEVGLMLRQVAELPGEKDEIYIQLFKIEEAIREQDFPLADQELKMVQEALKQAFSQDEEIRQKLRDFPDLAPLAGDSSQSQAFIETMTALTLSQKEELASGLAQILKDLPSSQMKSALEDLLSALNDQERGLTRALQNLFGLKDLEESLLQGIKGLGEHLTPYLESSQYASAQGRRKEIEEGPGLGTSGGLPSSTQEEEDQSSYSTSGASNSSFSDSLIYVPREFEQGEPDYLPGESSQPFKLYEPGSGSQGEFLDRGALLPQFEKKAQEALLSPTYPPFLEELIREYFLNLEK